VHRCWHAVVLAIVLACALVPARAAELDGVQLPNEIQADGKMLQLNGYGLRTYSILGIHIYVAGLYLEHTSTDAEAILHSHDTKLLVIKFKRNVSADASRDAWRKGLANNCTTPCRLDPSDVATFLAGVPAMHAGESYSLLFTGHGAIVTADGMQIGDISSRPFAEVMLATFLGPAPASQLLKEDLLKGHG
jgi:MFS superfamily sulfate permease-like transporter